MQKTAKTTQKTPILAGVVIFMVALSIIFVTIAVPHMRENAILKGRLKILLEGEYERITLSDPLYKNGATPLERGTEVLLTEAQIELMRTMLQTVADGGFRNVENKSMTSGAWNMKCQVRGLDGTRTDLYFMESEIYFYADGTAFCFEPKDFSAYDAFYAYLRALLVL